MAQFDSETPIVLSLSSLDPSGCAGIQADIETTASLGCHCTPVITALCAKDTQSIKDISPVETGLLIEQARAILEDMPVNAIKIGMLGSLENAEAIYTILCDYPDIPVVLDPVTAEYNQELFNSQGIVRAIKALLLPRTTIATPDLVEAHEFAKQADTVDACAHEILESGCSYVLITGSIRNGEVYGNSLYGDRRLIRNYERPRIKMISHGAGATLAAALTSYIAHGIRLEEAVEQAQNFTWHALNASRRLGMGHCVPNRMHWAINDSSAAKKQNYN